MFQVSKILKRAYTLPQFLIMRCHTATINYSQEIYLLHKWPMLTSHKFIFVLEIYQLQFSCKFEFFRMLTDIAFTKQLNSFMEMFSHVCQKQLAFDLVLHNLLCQAIGQFQKISIPDPQQNNSFFFFNLKLHTFSLLFLVLQNPSPQEIFATLSANKKQA